MHTDVLHEHLYADDMDKNASSEKNASDNIVKFHNIIMR